MKMPPSFRRAAYLMCSNATSLKNILLNGMPMRLLLTSAYNCEEAWKARLGTPALKQLKAYDLAVKLQEKLDKEGKVAPVDIDVLANKVQELDVSQMDFVQNIFRRFRLTPECVHITPATSYALVTSLLHHGETDRLLEILQDKLKYGIFLDDFSCNMLLDHFIEKKSYADAAKIAYDQMLQESFEHPLKRHLSWLACHLYWRNLPEQTEPVVEAVAQEEEEVVLRVNYLSTPYYDDHFDLYKDTLRLGKTLVMITKDHQGLHKDPVSTSHLLVGLGLWEKFDQGLRLMEEIVTQEGRRVARDSVEDFVKRLESVQTKEPPTEATPMGAMKMVDVHPYITAQQKDELNLRLKELLTKLESKMEVFDLEKELRSKVIAIVEKQEPVDIAKQKELFVMWENSRNDLLQEQMKAYDLEKRKVVVAQKLKELQEKEEKLRFFEEHGRITLGISRAPKPRQLLKVTLEEETFVAPPGERKGKAN